MLRDYEGNYEEFLEKNDDEAEKMAVKEERVKEIEKVGRRYPVLCDRKSRLLGPLAAARQLCGTGVICCDWCSVCKPTCVVMFLRRLRLNPEQRNLTLSLASKHIV